MMWNKTMICKYTSGLTVGLMLSMSSLAATSFGVEAPSAATPETTPATGAAPAPVSDTTATVNQLLAPQASTTAATSPTPATTVDNASDPSLGDTSLSQEAFSKTVQNLMPLSPDQIKSLRKMYDNTQKATAAYPGTPPKPTSSTVSVDLSPGATPPVIRLQSGFVTSLVFLDSTGQPWPIIAYDLGDPDNFSIQPSSPDGKSNTLMVQASNTYQSGNIAVMLKNQNTPIMLTLMPGQEAVDYRDDLRIPGLGPNAQPMVSGLPTTTNPQLVNFLDGVPPDGATELHIEGDQSQVWEYQGMMYLRTRNTLLSPSWISVMSSPDGTNAYELTKAPVILVTKNGKMTQLKVEGI